MLSSRADQVVTGGWGGDYTGDMEVYISSKAETTGSPGLFMTIGYSIKCPNDIITYGSENGDTQLSVYSHTMIMSDTKSITSWSTSLSTEIHCQFAWRAETIATANTSKFGISLSNHLATITYESVDNKPVPKDFSSSSGAVTMRKSLGGGTGGPLPNCM